MIYQRNTHLCAVFLVIKELFSFILKKPLEDRFLITCSRPCPKINRINPAVFAAHMMLLCENSECSLLQNKGDIT